MTEETQRSSSGARSDEKEQSGSGGVPEPLTDKRICKIAAEVVMRANFFPPEDWISFARAIERALGAVPLDALKEKK